MQTILRQITSLVLLLTSLLAVSLPAAGACPNLAGPWTVTENVNLIITVNGDSQTQNQSGTGDITLTQSGCTVTYYQDIPDPNTGGTYRAQRVGTISGNTVTFTGIAMVPIQGLSFSKNSMVCVGTISPDGSRIDATSTVNVAFSGSGVSGTVTGGGTEVFVSNAPATITVQANPANGGTVSGGGTFPVGSQQQISASPALCFIFTGWNDGNADNPRTITVPSGGTNCTANFTNILKDSVHQFQAPHSYNMNVSFLPKDARGNNLSMAQATSICGVDHFNWIQHIIYVPDHWKVTSGLYGGEPPFFGSVVTPPPPLLDPIVNSNPDYYYKIRHYCPVKNPGKQG